jgi:hypothetical protein
MRKPDSEAPALAATLTPSAPGSTMAGSYKSPHALPSPPIRSSPYKDEARVLQPIAT